ncbi:MAG: branched-chain amino acid ABC transporter permease [Deltaproteobacteria bacterium]
MTNQTMNNAPASSENCETEGAQSANIKRYLANPYALISVFAILEVLYYFVFGDAWIIRILIICNIYALYAASWDLVGGFLGQVSIGHSLFFGGAAYVSSLLSLHFGWPILVVMLLGVLSGVLFALILGLPTLRLKGPYFSVVTMVTPMVFVAIIFMYPVELGGDCGYTGFAALANGNLNHQFLIILTVCLASVLTLIKISRSNYGLVLKAIREDDFAAEAAGLNITKHKIINFIISGVFASLAGVLFVHFQGAAAPAMLEGLNSMMPIIMTITGGMGTIVGPIIGAYLISFLNEYLISFPEVRIILYCAVTILILRFAPAGIMGWLKKLYK